MKLLFLIIIKIHIYVNFIVKYFYLEYNFSIVNSYLYIMSLVKKTDQDDEEESSKKTKSLILKSQYDESKPKRLVKVLDEETFITV